jgi:hypothetical protein
VSAVGVGTTCEVALDPVRSMWSASEHISAHIPSLPRMSNVLIPSPLSAPVIIYILKMVFNRHHLTLTYFSCYHHIHTCPPIVFVVTRMKIVTRWTDLISRTFAKVPPGTTFQKLIFCPPSQLSVLISIHTIPHTKNVTPSTLFPTCQTRRLASTRFDDIPRCSSPRSWSFSICYCHLYCEL